MKRQPLVSVVMPVYNAKPYLVPAIKSILKQTYKNIEFIIVDDLSTDGSLAIIEKYASSYPQIRLIKMKRNLNSGGDRCANEGIKKARGKYIGRMDADDIAHPKRLEAQVAFLEQHKGVFLVGSNAHVINAQGEIIGEKKEPLTPQDIYASYFTFHPLIHPSCMFRSKINGRKFSYRLSYTANNDYLTFFTLLCRGAVFANLPEKLLYYRIHGKNDTFINMKEKFFNTLKIRLTMVAKYGYKPDIPAIMTNVAQTVVVLLLPEKLLFTLYLTSKGILKKESLFPKITIDFGLKPFQLALKKALA